MLTWCGFRCSSQKCVNSLKIFFLKRTKVSKGIKTTVLHNQSPSVAIARAYSTRSGSQIKLANWDWDMWAQCQSCWERCALTTKNGEVQPFVVLCALICLYFTDSVTSGLAGSDFWMQTASAVVATSLSLILSLVWCERARTWILSYFTCMCGSSSGSDFPGQKVRKTVSSVFSSHLFFIPASLLDFLDGQRFWRLSSKRRGVTWTQPCNCQFNHRPLPRIYNKERQKELSFMSHFLLQKRSITVHKSQLYRIMWQKAWLMPSFEEPRITLWEISSVSYFHQRPADYLNS